jgi:UDP-N-acetylglucosamine--N-acetylmuramyl-(pentapeptide) pyrophosphoryl-undecaprenol N-acetylglucosamine transferase
MPNAMIPYRILISGGGTGGHVFPAISIAQAFLRREPTAQIHFVGAMGKMEMTQVPLAGFSITGLWIRGFQRHTPWANWKLPIQLVHSMLRSLGLILQKRPHLVVGVGGYASGPLLWIAQMLGYPTVIQEQNAIPGKTNLQLSKRVQRIYVAFDAMNRYFDSRKIRYFGNPVRSQITASLPAKSEAMKYWGLDSSKKVILVLGGSQGARAINKAIENFLLTGDKQFAWIWQCGNSYNLPQGLVNDLPTSVIVRPFLQEMDWAYAAADLIVSRAGAGTMSELAVVGKPCILIPSPYVAENHQYHNALNWVQRSAAWMSSDHAIAQDLPDLLRRWSELCDGIVFGDQVDKLQQWTNSLRAMALPDAADRIAADMQQLLQEGGKP